jgi:hypothetical protein
MNREIVQVDHPKAVGYMDEEGDNNKEGYSAESPVDRTFP